MEENTKVLAIIAALQAAYPEPRCALEYQKDYELMVAVRLVGAMHRRAGQRGDSRAVRRLIPPWRLWANADTPT